MKKPYIGLLLVALGILLGFFLLGKSSETTIELFGYKPHWDTSYIWTPHNCTLANQTVDGRYYIPNIGDIKLPASDILIALNKNGREFAQIAQKSTENKVLVTKSSVLYTARAEGVTYYMYNDNDSPSEYYTRAETTGLSYLPGDKILEKTSIARLASYQRAWLEIVIWVEKYAGIGLIVFSFFYLLALSVDFFRQKRLRPATA